MTTPALTTSRGLLTPYALACGYVEVYRDSARDLCKLCGQRIDDGKPCGCGAR